MADLGSVGQADGPLEVLPHSRHLDIGQVHESRHLVETGIHLVSHTLVFASLVQSHVLKQVRHELGADCQLRLPFGSGRQLLGNVLVARLLVGLSFDDGRQLDKGLLEDLQVLLHLA